MLTKLFRNGNSQAVRIPKEMQFSKIIGANDLLIVAHATSLNVPLVTNNPKEFARVDDLILYKKYYSLSVAAANISRTCIIVK